MNIKGRILKGSVRSVKAKKSIVKMLINKGLGILISMLYIPLCLKCMDETRYGIWLALMGIINWVSFLDIGIGHGLRNLLSISLANGDLLTSRKLVSTAYIIVIFIFSVIIIAALLLYPYIDWYKFVNAPNNMMDEINNLIVLVLCIMCANFILGIIKSVFYAYQEPHKVTDILLFTQIMSLLVVFVFSLFGPIKSLVLIGTCLSLVQCFVSLIYSIFYFSSKYKDISPSLAFFDIKCVKGLFGLGITFLCIQISNLVCFHSTDFFVTNILSPEHVPSIHIATRYLSMLLLVFTNVTTPLWSATTEAYEKGDIKWIRTMAKKMIKIFSLFVVLALFMILVAPIFFHIWIGDKIIIDISLVILMAIYVLMQMFATIYISFINGIGKIRLQLYISVVSPLIYIPLALFLGKLYGGNGIVFAGIIVLVLWILLYPIQFYKLLTNNGRDASIWYK